MQSTKIQSQTKAEFNTFSVTKQSELNNTGRLNRGRSLFRKDNREKQSEKEDNLPINEEKVQKTIFP